MNWLECLEQTLQNGLVMSTNVKVETARLSKDCVTQVTFEWFFTSMNAPVFLKVGTDNKGTVTHVTFVCLLTRVTFHVIA